MRQDYGTATSEEILDGFRTATKIAELIRQHPNPAVQNMLKELVKSIYVCREERPLHAAE